MNRVTAYRQTPPPDSLSYVGAEHICSVKPRLKHVTTRNAGEAAAERFEATAPSTKTRPQPTLNATSVVAAL